MKGVPQKLQYIPAEYEEKDGQTVLKSPEKWVEISDFVHYEQLKKIALDHGQALKKEEKESVEYTIKVVKKGNLKRNRLVGGITQEDLTKTIRSRYNRKTRLVGREYIPIHFEPN